MGYYVLKAESYNDDVKSHQEERPSQICKRKIIQKKIQCYRISIFSSKVNNEICKTSLKRKKPQEKNFVKFKLFKNFLMSSKKLMSATTSSYSKSTSDYFGTTSMLKTLHTILRAFVVFASKVWTFICYVFRKKPYRFFPVNSLKTTYISSNLHFVWTRIFPLQFFSRIYSSSVSTKVYVDFSFFKDRK